MGTGNGVSVLELVDAMRKDSGKPISLRVSSVVEEEVVVVVVVVVVETPMSPKHMKPIQTLRFSTPPPSPKPPSFPLALSSQFTDRRPGDVAKLYTDPSFAQRILKWKATRGLEDMCKDTWNWQSRNPQGFRPPSS